MAKAALLSTVKTTVSEAGEDARLSAAFFQMEPRLLDVQNMVRIVMTLLEDRIGHDHSAVTGHPEKYWLASEDVNMMLFSAMQAVRMVNETVEHWYAEIKEGN